MKEVEVLRNTFFIPQVTQGPTEKKQPENFSLGFAFPREIDPVWTL